MQSLNIKNAFIDFKSNAIPQKGKSFAWRRQLELFKEHPEIWKENYRYRVIVEGVISSIKRKCLNYLRSKKPIAMDTELLLKNARARVAVISKPLNPNGLAFALRRHRDDPWTYPLFIKNKMFNPLAAGLLGFLVDGSRSLLFAGTRSSGKTFI